MKSALQTPVNPSSAELSALQQLCQIGCFAEAEVKAGILIVNYPKSMPLLNILAICQQQQGKLREAAGSLQKMLKIEPNIAEIHFNLGCIWTELRDIPAATGAYRKSLQLKPDLTVAYFNLGALLQTQGQNEAAAQYYRKALAQQPNYLEAQVNLGSLLQQQGQFDEAEACYRQALILKEDARGHYNLGTVLYARGKLEEAAAVFKSSVELEPEFADAWNSLGEIWRDRGNMDEAVRCYRQAIAVAPSHGRALYNMGEYLCLANRMEEAIPYFDDSDFADSKERALQSLYKTRQFERFKQAFDELTAKARPPSVLMAALAEHYASNFQDENRYPFCKQPMKFVQHTRIDELAKENSPLLTQLLDDIRHLAIAERKQGRLYYGIQSAGNLLMRSEHSFKELARLIRLKITQYRQHYKHSQDDIIRKFPREIEFASSWYLRMNQGGYLTSHIHEEGWVSGCVYLKLPAERNDHAGSFCYGTDGDDYPRMHDNFPSRIADIQVGDLVLFPSSLFHRTIPFQSDEERVCVAFDVKPG